MVALQLVSAGLTDRGKKRIANEDTILDHTGLTESEENYGLYIVCDGLGGHGAGDTASHMAVRTVVKMLSPIIPPPLPDRFTAADVNQKMWEAVQEANRQIWQHAQASEIEAMGMATTLTMAAVFNNIIHVAHVGDSRLYLWRTGEMIQLTQDHSMAAALADAGYISQKEVKNHPRSNVLTKVVGRAGDVDVDLMEVPLLKDDRLLLCSDGLWKAFPEDETLQRRFEEMEEPAELCKELVNEANRKDGSDNISGIVVAARGARQERLKVKAHPGRERLPLAV
jgi:protein phosphatase